ncbi:hypothetical protein HMI54_013254, partial [Coelomomyces lativittatus]
MLSSYPRCNKQSVCLILKELIAFPLSNEALQLDVKTLIVNTEINVPLEFRFEKNNEAHSFQNCSIFVESKENGKTDHWDLVHCDKETCLFIKHVYFVQSRLPSIYIWEDLYKKESLTLNA